MRKGLLLTLIASFAVLTTGCSVLGMSEKATYERAYYAANERHDLEVARKEAGEIIARYQQYYASNQREKLESNLVGLAAQMAHDENLSETARARFVLDLARQYGTDLLTLETNLRVDSVEADQVLSKISAGSQAIDTLMRAQDIERRSEAELNEYYQKKALEASSQIETAASEALAQKKANEELEERLSQLERVKQLEEEATPEPEPEPTPAPAGTDTVVSQ